MTSFAILRSVLLPVVLTGAPADIGAAAPIAPPLEQIAANCDRPTYAEGPALSCRMLGRP